MSTNFPSDLAAAIARVDVDVELEEREGKPIDGTSDDANSILRRRR